jgi:hypothetical protein
MLPMIAFVLLSVSCGPLPEPVDAGEVEVPLNMYDSNLETRKLTQKQVTDTLNANSRFYLNVPRHTTEGTLEKPLIECLIEDLTAEAMEGSLVVRGEVKKGDCFRPEWGTDLAPESLTKVDYEIRCNGGDFTKWNGQQVRYIAGFFELDFPDICGVEAEKKVAIRSTVLLEGKSVRDVYQIAFESTYATKGFCSRKHADKKVYDSGCTEGFLTKTTKFIENGVSKEEKLGTDQQILRSVNLEGNDDITSVYYNKGQFDLIVNGWKGDMKYSTSIDPPQYVMQKGLEVVEAYLPRISRQ